MAKKNHLKIIKEGSEAWNAWRGENHELAPDLSLADLFFADLNGADLSGTDLSGANLFLAKLNGADLSGADLSGADLSLTKFSGANLSGANLRGANLHVADLSEANLTGADLSLAELSLADFSEANLGGVDLSGADFSGLFGYFGPNLSRANLSGANLSHANFKLADLSGADLRRASLFSADLREADLCGANLSEANLRRANLRVANLSRANLTGADLSATDISGAKLTRAKLNRAHLIGASLTGADLRGANFSGAFIGLTTFGNVDLSRVKGMETVIHRGPCTLGVDTLINSNGKIPEVFLRGTGVPEDFITFISSLGGRAFEFYSCFISYSHHDEEFSQRLHARMRSKSLRVWYAPEDMPGGKKLHEEIFRAIQIHDKLLLVLSENSMKSEWVMTEIRRARKVEREENRRKLFPIRLVDFDALQKWECFDADSGKDLAIELREYYIADFSNWKDHDAFEAEFAKLLRDLKATQRTS